MEFAFDFGSLLVGVISLLLSLAWFISKLMSQTLGPPCWPIVGSLFYLKKLPHHSMKELAKKYGPIMYLHLGYMDHIVISNVEMAMEVLKIHDVDFASRLCTIVGKYASFDWSNIALSPYGDHWCLLHKICNTKLFT
jgi:hypothetical protein